MNELIDVAIVAYRNRCYTDAMLLLHQALADDSKQWVGHLYLAMTYYKVGRRTDAIQLFDWIARECPEDTMKRRALEGLQSLRARTPSTTLSAKAE